MRRPGGSLASRVAFTELVAFVGGLRIAELRLSARHEAALVARGGVVHASQMPAMRAMHGAWFASMLAEVWALPTRPGSRLAALGIAGLGAGMALRAGSQRALDDRWTASIVTIPGEARVQTGVFRLMRHPNYLGVAAEIAAVPLVHGAWRTAVVFSVLDAALLAVRIRAEERALRQDIRVPGTQAHEAPGGNR